MRLHKGNGAMAGAEAGDLSAVDQRSDLPVRVASAVVMVAIAGVSLWIGGWLWSAFAVIVAAGVLWEWNGLVAAFEQRTVGRALWIAAGVIYVGVATLLIVVLRNLQSGALPVLTIVAAVVATDIGAYFAGRTIGGPKIAPRISPSKTWAGLGGGIVGASFALLAVLWGRVSETGEAIAVAFAGGAVIAVVAQTGDFFESWMKRRAGVKDSSSLIPGHGGLFDRADGLIAVLFVIGIALLVSSASYLVWGGDMLPTPS